MNEPHAAHLSPDEIELWAEGLLPAARSIHLSTCHACLSQAEAERRFFLELSQLERLAPRPGFANRVLARVRIETPVEER